MRTIRIGHSPDADDAFMFYALTHGKVEVPAVRVEHVLEDIESLNRRAATGELDVTAVSCASYPARSTSSSMTSTRTVTPPACRS